MKALWVVICVLAVCIVLQHKAILQLQDRIVWNEKTDDVQNATNSEQNRILFYILGSIQGHGLYDTEATNLDSVIASWKEGAGVE